MAVNLSPIWGAGAQLFDNSGNVLSGGKIYTYAAGTTTPAATYTSSNGITANSNPIILNSAGRIPYEIWMTDGISYKFVLKDSNDTLIGTWDNLTGINSNFIAYTAQQEIQTATAGQTVFTLATIQYQPGTHSLSVYVDGVNQYGPGAQYAYVETSSSVVTFVSGLHVGASVKFTTASPVSSSSTNAQNVSYKPPFIGSVGTNVADKLAQTVSVKDFGAVGDGVTDDTAAIQAAIDATPYSLIFPTGTYKLSSTITIDKDIEIDFCDSVIYTSASTAFSSEGTLKATTSAASYSNTTDRNSILVADASGFAVGDLINVISSDLFDTSRLYYYKGGSAVITEISGNRVYFSLTSFGYDMSTGIVVKDYEPVTVNIKNLKLLESTAALADSDFGFYFAYHKDSVIDNVTTNLFQNHISVKRSVDCVIKNSETRKAINSSGDSWDGYGIIDYSCNGTIVENCITFSGQHGVTTGGQEVVYNFSVSNSFMKAERYSLGFGPHENMMRCVVTNCEMLGAVLTGQCYVYNSKFTKMYGRTDSVVLTCGELSTRPNYFFENCTFDANIELLDYYQVPAPTRKYVNKITFNNCVSPQLALVVASQSLGVKIASVNEVSMTNCSDFKCTVYDKLTKLNIENSYSGLLTNVISQGANSGVYEKIDWIYLNNVQMPSAFNVLYIKNAGTVYIGNYNYGGVNDTFGRIELSNITNLTFDNFIQPSVDSYGTVVTSISNLKAVNSTIVFYGGISAAATASTVFTSRNTNLNTELVDVWTNSGGTKYKVGMGSGSFTITGV